ncbi:MAG: endonuclease V [Planctomycetota bacterium]|nr:endonuclease V [Planctomycetota bacterium]
MIIAGYDISYSKHDPDLAVAALSLFNDAGKVIEEHIETVTPGFPYEPGKLYLREKIGLDILLPRVQNPIDVLVIDGNGTIHPEKFGAACRYHQLYKLDTIGIAKNLLSGTFQDLAPAAGSKSPVILAEEHIGYAYRAATDVKPIFISTGCALTQDHAVEIVTKFHNGFRIPEITRRPDMASRERLRTIEGPVNRPNH